MAILMGLMAVVPLAILGTLLVATSQKAIKTSVLRDQEQIAIRAAGEIGTFIARPQGILRSAAGILGVLHAEAWKQETALVELALNEGVFGRLSSVGADGKEIATSELGTTLRDFSSDETFKPAIAGTSYVSDVYYHSDHTPYVKMSVPVRQYGKVVGALVAEVGLRGFWAIVDEIQIGKTGSASVVSRQGVLIADQDKKKVLENQNWLSDKTAQAVLNGKTGSAEHTDAEGTQWLRSYAPVKTVGWGVFVNQSAAEAYSFLYVMELVALIFIVLTILAAILASILLAPKIVKPVQLLSERMFLVAEGHFDQEIAVQRKDEIGKLLVAFNEMTRKLKKARESERLAAIGKAAAMVTHELRNSLIMAGTFIRLLPEHYKDKSFLEKFITVVPQELDNWQSMLDDITDFSKRPALELFRLNVNVFLKTFTSFIEQRLAEGNVRLKLSVPDGLPMVQANEQRLNQVLTNLIMNAVDAMPDGGQLRLSAETVGAHLCIGIQDSGKGIPEENLQSIFDPFYTTKPNGLGLGLNICREIIEQHGGRLQVQSLVGQGTSFTVRLPVEAALPKK